MKTRIIVLLSFLEVIIFATESPSNGTHFVAQEWLMEPYTELIENDTTQTENGINITGQESPRETPTSIVVTDLPLYTGSTESEYTDATKEADNDRFKNITNCIQEKNKNNTQEESNNNLQEGNKNSTQEESNNNSQEGNKNSTQEESNNNSQEGNKNNTQEESNNNSQERNKNNIQEENQNNTQEKINNNTQEENKNNSQEERNNNPQEGNKINIKEKTQDESNNQLAYETVSASESYLANEGNHPKISGFTKTTDRTIENAENFNESVLRTTSEEEIKPNKQYVQKRGKSIGPYHETDYYNKAKTITKLSKDSEKTDVNGEPTVCTYFNNQIDCLGGNIVFNYDSKKKSEKLKVFCLQ